MKKQIILALVATAGIGLTGCNGFLDDNRYPLTNIVNSPEYWSNTSNVQLQVDRFTDEISSAYGSGGGYGDFYFGALNDDQVGSNFANWAYPTVPGSAGDWTYTNIRGTNYIIEGVESSSLKDSEKANFLGIARLVRGYMHYNLVRKYGNVVWEDHVVDLDEGNLLFGERNDRDEVMDKVLEDLQFAVANIAAESSKTAWSKDYARAILCDVALYEGTFCKYRTVAENGKAADLERANRYLQIAASTAETLLGKYGFTDNYQSIYNSLWVADAANGITGLSENPELIYGRRYDKTNGRHSTISYTASSTTTSGMSLDAFKAFLFKDGKPEKLTSCNTSMVGVPDAAANTYSIQNLLDQREARLSIITDPYVYYKGMEWSREGCAGMNSSSGFGIAKFDNVNLPVDDRTNSANNYTSCPIYWTSYIALNYAEAKAELGQFDDAAFNKSLKKLYERAGLGDIVTGVSYLANLNDPDNNMGVSSLIWEIRRCRRCELMFDGKRYWDLVRWHQLDKLDSTQHPNILRGAYVANAPSQPAIVDGEGYMHAYNTNRVYDKKYYLYPMPTSQLSLAPQLGQNPGW